VRAGSPGRLRAEDPFGLTIYHAGDTGIFAGMALIGELYPIDVAMLPIGSVFTMDHRQAAKACALLNTKAVIPMHYGTFPILEQTADRFVAELAIVSPGTRPIVLARGRRRHSDEAGTPLRRIRRRRGGAPLPYEVRSLGYPAKGKTWGTVRPVSRVPFPKRPCTERVDAPPPARRPTEAYQCGTVREGNDAGADAAGLECRI